MKKGTGPTNSELPKERVLLASKQQQLLQQQQQQRIYILSLLFLGGVAFPHLIMKSQIGKRHPNSGDFPRGEESITEMKQKARALTQQKTQWSECFLKTMLL